MKTQKQTTDFYFAAALLSLGCELDHTDKTNPSHMEFHIKSELFSSENLPGLDLDDIEKQWINGKLMVNGILYKNAIQQLKSVIHSR